jgi:protein PsiE
MPKMERVAPLNAASAYTPETEEPMSKHRTQIDRVGGFLVDGFQFVALFVIGATIVWAAVDTYWELMQHRRAGLEDILLLFIYLELGTMVGIYFKTEHLPVQFLLYVAITAMTRFLVIDIKLLPVDKILLITGAIVLLTVAALILRVGSARFATSEDTIAGQGPRRRGK